MKLNKLNIINYRIVDAHNIAVQYHKEFADFISKNKEMLQLKAMESIVHATISGMPLDKEETKLAAHTTNIICYLVMTGRDKELPKDPHEIVPLALAVASIEEMVMEQILMDDEELEEDRKKE